MSHSLVYNIANAVEKAQMCFFNPWAAGPVVRCICHCAAYEVFSGSRFDYKIHSDASTTRQHAAATRNRLPPRQARTAPAISASAPAAGLRVASTMAGKVITASVT